MLTRSPLARLRLLAEQLGVQTIALPEKSLLTGWEVRRALVPLGNKPVGADSLLDKLSRLFSEIAFSSLPAQIVTLDHPRHSHQTPSSPRKDRPETCSSPPRSAT